MDKIILNDKIESEKEWRRYLMKEVSDIKESQDQIRQMIYISNLSLMSLKVKTGTISAGIALLTSVAITYVVKKLGAL